MGYRPKTLKFFLLLLFVLTSNLVLVTSNLYALDKIIAVVNNDIITQKDLDDFVNFTRLQLQTDYTGQEIEGKINSIRADLLQRLIEDRLILQEAKKSNIKVDEARVKAKITQLRKRYGSDTEFQSSLTQQGLVQADIEVKIREQLLMYTIIDEKIKNKVKVSPREITAFYQENKELFSIPEERDVESVSIEDKNQAKEISDRLKNGERFEELANKYSLVPDKMNVFKDGQLKKEIEDAVFQLSQNQATEPIEIKGKFYIFKLNKVIPPRQASLQEVQGKIYASISSKKMQEELANWLNEVKKHSYIKILQDQT